MRTNSNSLTLVLGATGKTGKRVARRLASRGVPIRIGSRSGAPPFDWNDPETWGPVLEGVGSAYLVYATDLAAPRAADTIRSFAAQAAAGGVRHLVLLSGRGEEEARQCELAVQESGTAWTILRSSWFSQNFSESFLCEAVASGEVALPVHDIAEPFVDADDIADVAVAALTENGHTGKVYELTGPRLLTFREAVGEIAAATGRHIRYVPLSYQAFAGALTRQGVPPEDVELLGYLFTTVLDGRNAYVTDGVQRALGLEPRDFRQYARRVAASGVWPTGEVAQSRSVESRSSRA